MKFNRYLAAAAIVAPVTAATVFGVHAATSPSPPPLDATLLEQAPCTVTLTGTDYTGTCSGAFVEAAASPSPTPSATPSATPSPPPAPGSFGVSAANSSSAQIAWNVPAGVTRIQILRNGRLLDDFGFVGGTQLTYNDFLLWQSTGYTYEVKGLNPTGAVISDLSASVTTPAQSGPFPVMYAATSFWNQPIPANPAIDANSSAMVSTALVPYAGSGNLANSSAWGKPIGYANSVSTQYSIDCLSTDCVTFHIPTYAVPDTGSDGHMIVIDSSTGTELDMWQASFSASTWNASWRGSTDNNGWGAMCAQGEHCPAADAAGFALAGGQVRPEEIAQGHIDHALFLTTPYTRANYIACPATHTDGQFDTTSAIPEGGRVQLDPAFNVDAQPWPRWEKVIAHALQTYGAYVGDTGGSLAIFGENNLDRGYDAWSLAGVPAGAYLNNLPWDRFRVLQLQPC